MHPHSVDDLPVIAMHLFTRSFGRRPTAVGAVSALLLSVVALAVGQGHSPHRLDLLGGNAWLASNHRGQIVRVNGTTGRPDAGIDVGKKGALQIMQDGDFVVVRNAKGEVRRIDTRNLEAGPSQSFGSADFTVVVGGGTAYAVDKGKGIVRPLDASTLAPRGAPLRLAGPITDILVDSTGTAWALVPSTGTIVSVRGRTVSGAHRYGARGDQGHLTLSGDLVIIVNETSGGVGTVGDGDVHLVPSGVSGDVLAAPSERTGPVFLVAPDAKKLVRYDPDTHRVTQIAAPELTGHDLGAPQQVGDRVYLPDYSTGGLIQLDVSDGAIAGRVSFLGTAGHFQLFVAGGSLWANNADGSQGLVIDQHGNMHRISKYDDNLPGLAQPSAPQPPRRNTPVFMPAPQGPPSPSPTLTPTLLPQSAPSPLPTPSSTPTTQPPGTPVVMATAGDTTVEATWSVANNGAVVSGYSLTITPAAPRGGGPGQVSGTTTSTQFTKLKNGTPYVVTVVAHTDHGDSPIGSSQPVTPRAGLPSTPVIQTVTPGDGTVTIAWTEPAPSAKGKPTVSYTLTATPVGAGANVVTAPATNSPASIPNLANGVPYRITVTANAANGTSSPSAQSAPVQPFGKPGAPTITATPSKANGNQGTVTLTISAGNTGGRPITAYRLTGPGAPASVTPGPNGNASATATVQAGPKNTWTAAAVNAAGAGPVASASATVVKPGPAPGTTITVGFKGKGFTWIGPQSGDKWAPGQGTHVYHNYFAMNGGASTVNWLGGCRNPGSNSQHTGATWNASLPAAGRWTIKVRVPGGANDPRGDTGLVAGTQYTLPNGKVVVTGGGPGWLTLGTASLSAGGNTVRLTDQNTQFNCSVNNTAVYLTISDLQFVYAGP